MVYTVNGEQFTRRKLLTINTAAAALTDYQIKKTITYLSVMQSGMADIRFTTLSGANIPYWEESVIADTNADVWLNVPSISNTAATYLWQYYGNPNVSSASDGSNTFIQYNGQTSTDFKLAYVVSPPFILEGRLTQTSTEVYDSLGVASTDPVANGDGATMGFHPARLCYRVNYNDGSNTDALVAGAYQTDAVYKLVLDGTNVKFYANNVLENTLAGNTPTGNDMGIFYSQGTGDLKWVYIRKYTATEPSWDTDGAEEHQRRVPQFQN